MTKKGKKYYLGLDIGIGSVGWGIIGEENGEHWLEDFGVRLFNAPEESGGGKGKKTYAEKRREFRAVRRLLNRWHSRRKDLIKLFSKIFKRNFSEELKKFLDSKWTTNKFKFKSTDYNQNKYFNPYVTRLQALDREITTVELLFILLHISKNRGYKSFYLDDCSESKDKDIKKTKTAVKEVEKLREEFKKENGSYPRSMAELIVKSKEFWHFNNKNLLNVHNHNPKGIEFNKIDKKSEELSQDCRANEIIKQIIEETDKENLKWERSRKYYDLIKELDDNELSDEKKKVKLQKIVANKLGKLNHKHFIFPREFLEEEVQKILEEQSKYHSNKLKGSIDYTLYENGKPETKKFLIQEVIKKIIFRQRDFEDGPTKTEPKNQGGKERIRWNKEKTHWKKYNRNITSKSFDETVGFCQFFPVEKRGWQCSLIYCCYQFINEFSKVEINRQYGKEERVILHKEIIEWLLSPSGYKPTKNSKIKTQLKAFLKKKDINFEDEKKGEDDFKFGIEFLDYLKELKLKEGGSFYSALWNLRPQKFYLDYTSYKKTIFYKIGEIISKNITPRRRKEELIKLSREKFSLECFSKCLTELEKYGRKPSEKTSPSSVSFCYMIEAIRAFLTGKRYGEFQEDFKENQEKGLKKNPMFHPNLVRNSVVFRSTNQAIKIVKHLLKKYTFAAINIETGRNLWNSEEERNKILKDNKDKFKEKEQVIQNLKHLGFKDKEIDEKSIKKYLYFFL